MASPSNMCLVCKQLRAHSDNNIFDSEMLNRRLANVVLEGRNRLLTKDDVCSACMCGQCVAVLDKIEILELLKGQFITNFSSSSRVLPIVETKTQSAMIPDSPLSPDAEEKMNTPGTSSAPPSSETPTQSSEPVDAQKYDQCIPNLNTPPPDAQTLFLSSNSKVVDNQVVNNLSYPAYALGNEQVRQFIINSNYSPSAKQNIPCVMPLVIQCRPLTREPDDTYSPRIEAEDHIPTKELHAKLGVVNSNDDAVTTRSKILQLRETQGSKHRRLDNEGLTSVVLPSRSSITDSNEDATFEIMDSGQSNKERLVTQNNFQQTLTGYSSIRGGRPPLNESKEIKLLRSQLQGRGRPRPRARGRGLGRGRGHKHSTSNVSIKSAIPIQPKPSIDSSVVLVSNPLVVMQPSNPGLSNSQANNSSPSHAVNCISEVQNSRSPRYSIVINRGLINVGRLNSAYKRRIFSPDDGSVATLSGSIPDCQQTEMALPENITPDNSLLTIPSANSTSLLNSGTHLVNASLSPNSSVRSPNSPISNMIMIPISVSGDTATAMSPVNVGEKSATCNSQSISLLCTSQGVAASPVSLPPSTVMFASSAESIYTQSLIPRTMCQTTVTCASGLSMFNASGNASVPIHNPTTLMSGQLSSPIVSTSASPTTSRIPISVPGSELTSTTSNSLPVEVSVASTAVSTTAPIADPKSNTVKATASSSKIGSNTAVINSLSTNRTPHLPLSPTLPALTNNLRHSAKNSFKDSLKDNNNTTKAKSRPAAQGASLRPIFPKPYLTVLRKPSRPLLPKPHGDMQINIEQHPMVFHDNNSTSRDSNDTVSNDDFTSSTGESEQLTTSSTAQNGGSPELVKLVNCSNNDSRKNNEKSLDDEISAANQDLQVPLIAPHAIKVEKEDIPQTVAPELSNGPQSVDLPLLRMTSSGATMIYNKMNAKHFTDIGLVNEESNKLTPVAMVPFHDGLLQNSFSGTITCFLCISEPNSRSFSDVKSCENHFKNVHSQCLHYTCVNCEVVTKTVEDAENHMSQCYSNKSKELPLNNICKHEPPDYSASHSNSSCTPGDVTKAKQPSVFLCGACDATFDTHKECFKHIDSHTAFNMYECDLCQRLFETSILLKSHQQTTHLVYLSPI